MVNNPLTRPVFLVEGVTWWGGGVLLDFLDFQILKDFFPDNVPDIVGFSRYCRIMSFEALFCNNFSWRFSTS